MAELVNVSILQPITLRLSDDEQYRYKPGVRVMPYDHAQKLGLLRRILSVVEELTESSAQTTAAPGPSFVALDAVLDENLAAILKQAGYNNLAELSKATKDELLATKDIGPARYEEIQAALGRRSSDDGEEE